jgi:hypothetical protein
MRTSHGDFNLDRRVDGADVIVWQRGVRATGGQFQLGDANFDGAVNEADLAVWLGGYGVTAPVSASAAIMAPEPVATAQLLVYVAALVASQRAPLSSGSSRRGATWLRFPIHSEW